MVSNRFDYQPTHVSALVHATTTVVVGPTAARRSQTVTVVPEATANHHVERTRAHREVRFVDPAVKLLMG